MLKDLSCGEPLLTDGADQQLLPGVNPFNQSKIRIYCIDQSELTFHVASCLSSTEIYDHILHEDMESYWLDLVFEA